MEITTEGQESSAGRLATPARLVVASDERDMVALQHLARRLATTTIGELGALLRQLQDIAERGEPPVEDWPTFVEGLLADTTDGAILSLEREIALALATLIEHRRIALEKSGREAELGVFLAVADTDSSGYIEVRLNSFEARLLLRPGSREPRMDLGIVLTASRWLAGFVAWKRAPDVAGRELVHTLRQLAWERQPRHLAMLAEPEVDRPSPTIRKPMILFLHGLFSTDLGTFDGFIERWAEPRPGLPEPVRRLIGDSVELRGWPHDTLAPIEHNADELANLLVRQLDPEGGTVAFVCHSRGGLVARSVAEKLYEKDQAWQRRLAACITFGTPHRGASLADHPGRAVGAWALIANATAGFWSVLDIMAYAESRGSLPGIRDLRPASAEGFLMELGRQELRNAGVGRATRRLPLTTVGGRLDEPVEGSFAKRLAYRQAARFAGHEAWDGVVELASALADVPHDRRRIAHSDHFSYFNRKAKSRAAAIDMAVGELHDVFGLTTAIRQAAAPRPDTSVDYDPVAEYWRLGSYDIDSR